MKVGFYCINLTFISLNNAYVHFVITLVNKNKEDDVFAKKKV